MTCNELETREAESAPTLDRTDTLQTTKVDTFSINCQLLNVNETDYDVPKHKTFRMKMKEWKYKRDFFHTVLLCLAFMMSGAILGQRGPSILDLQIITNTDVQESSAFITILSVGYISGAILVGFLYDRMPKQLLLFINCLTTGIFLAVLPFCSNYILMLVITFIGALPLAGIDVVGNADIIRIWGDDGRSYMQAMHFWYAIGAVIGPLVTEPFLTPRRTENPHHIELLTNTILNISEELAGYNNSNENIIHYNTTIDVIHGYNTTTAANSLTFHSAIQNSTTNLDNETTDVYIAYVIIAAVCIVISIPVLILYLQPVTEKTERENVKNNHRGNSTVKSFVITLLLMNILSLFYIALEDTIPNFMLLFLVKSMNWSKPKGSIITSTYYTAFAVSRFSGIFIIRHFTPTKCLLIVYTSLVCSCIGFLLSTIHSYDPGVWVSLVGVGLSMGIMFPTNYTMFSSFVTLSGKIVSLLSIVASVGSIANPAILGPLMQHYSPMWYVYLVLGESVACLVCFLILLVYSKTLRVITN